MTRQLRYSRIQFSCSMSAERLRRICDTAEKNVHPKSIKMNIVVIMLYYQHPHENHHQSYNMLKSQLLVKQYDCPDFEKIDPLNLFNNKIENLDVLKKMKSLAFHNPANQHIAIIATNKTINAPVILKQAFKDLETTKIETTNCKVNDDKTTITIEDTSKDASIKIVDGKLIETTITIKCDKTLANKSHLQAGKSMTIVGGIVVLGGICFIMYKKNKSLKIK